MTSPKTKIPVTILNGFLGAGKTTILQRFLLQAKSEKDIELGIIVNEMSELDVDGRLISTNELLSRNDAKFASISAGSISGERGLEEFTAAIDEIKKAGVTHIIIETSGSTHPWPLLQAIKRHSGVALHGFLSVVDTVTLAQDHDFCRAIVPAVSRNLDAGKRGVENLLAEQIMFASRILMSKIDRVESEIVQKVGEAIHPINPWVDITGIQFGNIDLREILAMPPYDYDRVEKLGAELSAWDEEHGSNTMSSAEEYHIDSIVIEDPRPLHPRRLWDVYNHYLGTDIYRSKGFFWMPSRDKVQLLWNQTAGSVGLGVLNFWKIAVLEDESLNLSPEERTEMERRLADKSPEFGDRHCHLTVIGDKDNIQTFASALRECFCTPEEIKAWRAGKVFEDPWPEDDAL